jgi:hypothetical protein
VLGAEKGEHGVKYSNSSGEATRSVLGVRQQQGPAWAWCQEFIRTTQQSCVLFCHIRQGRSRGGWTEAGFNQFGVDKCPCLRALVAEGVRGIKQGWQGAEKSIGSNGPSSPS